MNRRRSVSNLPKTKRLKSRDQQRKVAPRSTPKRYVTTRQRTQTSSRQAPRQRGRTPQQRGRTPQRQAPQRSTKPLTRSAARAAKPSTRGTRRQVATDSMTLVELQKMARGRGVAFGGLTKTQLIKKINQIAV